MPKGFDFKALADMQRAMQERMAQMQEEVRAQRVEGTAGGGMVKVTVNGALEVVEVHIDPSIIDPEDPEMFEDLVMAATNQALEKARALAQEAQGKILGGILPPGLEGLLGR